MTGGINDKISDASRQLPLCAVGRARSREKRANKRPHSRERANQNRHCIGFRRSRCALGTAVLLRSVRDGFTRSRPLRGPPAREWERDPQRQQAAGEEMAAGPRERPAMETTTAVLAWLCPAFAAWPGRIVA